MGLRDVVFPQRCGIVGRVSNEPRHQTAAELTGVLGRAASTLEADERVRALFLAGSRATGSEDRFSDLDLLVVIDDESFEAFCGEWQSWVGELSPTVAAKPRSFDRGFLVNATTPSCARFDVFVRRVAGVTSHPGWERPAAVFDRDGIAQMLPEPRPPPALEHDAAWLSELIYMFIRTLSVLPMLLERGELVRLTQHAQLLKQDLLELLIFENGDPPCRRPGAWAWVDLSERLPATDLALVADLPALAATRDSVIEGHVGVASRFLPRARSAAGRAGEPFPSEFERAALALIERELGATIPHTA